VGRKLPLGTNAENDSSKLFAEDEEPDIFDDPALPAADRIKYHRYPGTSANLPFRP